MIKWLERDPLKYVVHLKTIQAHAEVVEYAWIRSMDGRGLVLWLPARATGYDREHYGDCDYVVLLAADNPPATKALLRYMPDGTLLFKLINPWDTRVLSEHYDLRRVTSFLSYTASKHSVLKPVENIMVNETLDRKCLELYVAQGHDHAEVRALFESDQAISFTRYLDGEPVASCYAFSNYKAVWEIAGVYTLPTHRRQGHARDVVAAALRALVRKGFWPRYQAHEENFASIALAEAMGLEHFLTVTHYLGTRR